MSTKTKVLIGLVIFAAFITISVVAYNVLVERYKPKDQLNIIEEQPEQEDVSNDTPSDTPNEESEEAPKTIAALDFTAYDAEGNEVKLSDYFGKPIVLNFWASWCGPCKSEMPNFDKVYNEVNFDVLFLMVDMVDGQKETEETGKDYISKQGYTFPVLYDTKQEAAYAYGIRSIPTTIFIDKDGNIVAGAEGTLDEESLLVGIEMIK